MFNWVKKIIANVLIKGILAATPERLREMMRQSVEKQKEKFGLGKPIYMLDGVENVTDIVDKTLTPKIYRDVEFYANVKADKYYLVDKVTDIVVAYGNLDGKTPIETINNDLEGYCAYYNVTIAFVLGDYLRLNYHFDNPIQLMVLKEEMASIGWRLNVGNTSTVIKEHEEKVG